MAQSRKHDSQWLSTKPTSLLETYVENALWHVNKLHDYNHPNSGYYASKVDEFDFLMGQLELRKSQ